MKKFIPLVVFGALLLSPAASAFTAVNLGPEGMLAMSTNVETACDNGREVVEKDSKSKLTGMDQVLGFRSETSARTKTSDTSSDDNI